MPYRICNFPKSDGNLCGSPALTGKKLCYYHQRDHQRRQYTASVVRRADVLGPMLPPMKSFYDIRAALNEVIQALAAGSISDRRAGRVLFDIQQASVALRQANKHRNSHATPYG